MNKLRHLNNFLRILSLIVLFGAVFDGMVSAQDLVTQPVAELQRVDEEIPGIMIRLRYATANNFTHKPIYSPKATAWLRAETIDKLKDVQDELREQGYQLVIWDAYRPTWAQERLWKACPNSDFVAPPKDGSRHARGTTVDVTLADLNGNLVEMPTDFDSFSPQASHDANDISAAAYQHREVLRQAMGRNGFTGVPAEWWHYDLREWNRYPLIP